MFKESTDITEPWESTDITEPWESTDITEPWEDEPAQPQFISFAPRFEIKSHKKIIKEEKPLSPVLIEGMLRQGHVMGVYGASKAGKSFALINLGISIVEGVDWMGARCKQGSVLFINSEIEEQSFSNRIEVIYKKRNLPPQNQHNIDILTLRGEMITLDELLIELLPTLNERKYAMIILDPIYLMLEGDENSASDQRNFCKSLIRLSKVSGASVAFSHHHSKGSKANTVVADRSAGSGVFARFPDAIIDITEVETDKEFEGVEGKLFYFNTVLREFESFQQKTILWKYPIHRELTIEESRSIKQENKTKMTDEEKEVLKNKKQEELMRHFESLEKTHPDELTLERLSLKMKKSEKTVRRLVKESSELYLISSHRKKTLVGRNPSF